MKLKDANDTTALEPGGFTIATTNGQPPSPIDEQIKFCQENKLEWSSALLSSGAVGLAAKKNVAMYEALEGTLTRYKELIIIAEMMHLSIHPVEEKSKKARSPESRIRDAKETKQETK